MRRRGLLAIDALVAILLVSAGLFIAVNSASAIVTNTGGSEAQLIYLHAALEKAMSACHLVAGWAGSSAKGIAKCNENYYFYGIVDSAAEEKISYGKLCVSRLAVKGEKVVKLTACGGSD